MTLQEGVDKLARLGVTFVSCPNQQFVTKTRGVVAPEILESAREFARIRRPELWQLLESMKPPEPQMELSDEQLSEIDAAFDAAIPWTEYASKAEEPQASE